MWLFDYLPQPMTAAILVVVGIRAVNFEGLKALWRSQKAQLWLAIIVAAGTTFFNPVDGFLAGFAATLLLFCDILSKGRCEVAIKYPRPYVTRSLTSVLSPNRSSPGRRPPLRRSDSIVAVIAENDAIPQVAQGGVIVYRISGVFTFINAVAHLQQADRFIGKAPFILDLRYLYHVDVDGLAALKELVKKIQATQHQVLFCGINEFVNGMLERTDWFQKLMAEGRILPTYDEALAALTSDEKFVSSPYPRETRSLPRHFINKDRLNKSQEAETPVTNRETKTCPNGELWQLSPATKSL
eukprot:TRINITY_DN5098_c0_g1_i1.p1 TRINITY_DN5098_c0_g1~~TRINITY_DN5098_c0_g1_i1.p1  ORF type:complete len:298 (+),score=64.70 TRINITY_DN5098_c0_g1_i1:751-1644(+)